MTASASRRFRRLLASKGYDLSESNLLGASKYVLTGCRDVWLYENTTPEHLKQLTRQVEQDTRGRDPEDTNEYRAELGEWEQLELERVARERADREAVEARQKAAWGIRPEQIKQIAALVEQREAEERNLRRLMTSRPFGAPARR